MISKGPKPSATKVFNSNRTPTQPQLVLTFSRCLPSVRAFLMTCFPVFFRVLCAIHSLILTTSQTITNCIHYVFDSQQVNSVADYVLVYSSLWIIVQLLVSLVDRILIYLAILLARPPPIPFSLQPFSMRLSLSLILLVGSSCLLIPLLKWLGSPVGITRGNPPTVGNFDEVEL